MEGCNVRLLSYISAGINMVVLAIMTIAMIVVMVLHQDKSRKVQNKESGIANINFDQLVYVMVASIGGFGCSILLIQGIRLNRYKYIYYYFWPLGLLVIVWGFISLNLLFGNIRLKKPVGTIILQFALCVIFIIFECVLFIPVFKLYKQMKATPLSTRPELHALNRH